ncbi:MAG: hypothetical protein ABJE66_05680 [Deltaproteobacteria bacterium]
MKIVPAFLLIAGCFPWSTMATDRPDPVLRKLADAKVLDMKVNLHKQPGLCPGHPGKLYVNATVQWPSMQPVLRALGRDVDSFDPAKFSITGPLIRGDADANLFPSDDVQASDDTGFETKVVYTLDPRWTFHEVFKPEYSCFTGWFTPGDNGPGGNGGFTGNSGGQGENGEHGSNGGPGGRGGSGGHITAYVTIVSTKFYPRLLAVISNGTFFLAPADRELTFAAVGGAGGSGGDGGAGGNGGDQKTESQDEYDDNNDKHTVSVGKGRAGSGGNGGMGGYGGDGGNGGTVDVIYDNAFPELRGLIATDVAGGEGGPGGNAGGGGAAGGSTADRNKQTGQEGQGGQGGPSGRPGGPGRASVHGGAVTSQFRNIHGIQIGGRH